MYLKTLLANPMFLTGIAFLFALTVASFAYGVFGDKDNSSTPVIIHNKNGSIKAQAPFPPSGQYPLGSDRFGNQMWKLLVEGAKYTIGLAVVISGVAMLISIVIGMLLTGMPKFLYSGVSGVFDAFHFMPLTIFCYLLITPVIKLFSWSYGPEVQFIFPFCVLIGLSVPILSIYIAKEAREVMKMEFIVNAKVLGPGKVRIFRKHALPYLYPKLLVVFSQQVARVLMVLAQLGLLDVFFGGGTLKVVDHERMKVNGILQLVPIKKMFSNSHEWAGMIGKYWMKLDTSPWLILGPVTAFALTIVAINFVSEGMKESMGLKRRPIFFKKKRTPARRRGRQGPRSGSFQTGAAFRDEINGSRDTAIVFPSKFSNRDLRQYAAW